jgi:hypothetical protein
MELEHTLVTLSFCLTTCLECSCPGPAWFGWILKYFFLSTSASTSARISSSAKPQQTIVEAWDIFDHQGYSVSKISFEQSVVVLNISAACTVTRLSVGFESQIRAFIGSTTRCFI